jgi:hypothetical protein
MDVSITDFRRHLKPTDEVHRSIILHLGLPDGIYRIAKSWKQIIDAPERRPNCLLNLFDAHPGSDSKRAALAGTPYPRAEGRRVPLEIPSHLLLERTLEFLEAL